jgi:hypothetical protein
MYERLIYMYVCMYVWVNSFFVSFCSRFWFSLVELLFQSVYSVFLSLSVFVVV